MTSHARSATFLLAWAREQADLALTLQTPGPNPVTIDFSEYLKPHDNVTALAGPTYKAIIARFPLDGTLVGKHTGTWKATLGRSQANTGPDEPYTFMVLADSPLQMQPVIPQVHLATGDRLPLLVDLAGIRLKSARVTADVYVPKQGLGAQLASMKLTDKAVKAKTADLMHDYNMLARRIALLRKLRPQPFAHDIHTVTLYDDGKHGDRRARDGVFGNVFGPLRFDGSYSVLYRAVGNTVAGERFRREFRRGLYVPLKLSATKTNVRITPPQVGGKVFTMTVIPRDVNGLLLGPGHADSVSLAGTYARIGAVVDNGDGSYRVKVTPKKDNTQMNLAVRGIPLRSVLFTAVP